MKNPVITPIATVPGQEFAEAFRIVATGANLKSNRLIDTHVLVVADAEEGTVTLRTAQIGYSFKYTIRNQAVQTGDMFTLGVSDMNKRLGVLKDVVTITRTASSVIQFNVGRMSFAMQSLDAGDFASDRSLKMHTFATFSGGELARYLRLALETVDFRSYLPIGGMWFRSSPEGDALILASAKEAHGGTRCVVPVELAIEEPLNVVVPKPMVEAMLVGLAVAEKNQGRVELMREASGDLLGVRVGDAIISGQLATGDFPKIDAMLTQEIATSCLVPRTELATTLNMISYSWTEKGMPGRTRLRFGRGEFQVLNPTDPQNQATFEIEVKGEPMSMDVNTRQVRGILSDLRSPVVKIAVTASAQRFVFITDPGDENYLHVAFPFTETYQREGAGEAEEEVEIEYKEAA